MEQELRILSYMLVFDPTINQREALLYISALLEAVKGYINQPTVPEAVEKSLANELMNLYSGFSIPGATSIKEGDTTITFGNADSNTWQGMVLRLKATLYPYRKVILV